MLSPLRKSFSCCEVIDIIVVVIGFSLEGYGSVGSMTIKSVLEQLYHPLHKIDQIEDGATYLNKPAKVLHLGSVDRLVPDGLRQILRILYLASVPILLRHEKHIVDVYSKDIARQMVNLDYLHFAMNNIGRKNTNSKSESGLLLSRKLIIHIYLILRSTPPPVLFTISLSKSTGLYSPLSWGKEEFRYNILEHK